MSTQKIVEEVVAELESAESKFAPFNSSHEGYAVLLEEVDELWDVVKLNPKKIGKSELMEFQEYFSMLPRQAIPDAQKKIQTKRMRAEAIQIAAMAIRFVKCVCENEDEA